MRETLGAVNPERVRGGLDREIARAQPSPKLLRASPARLGYRPIGAHIHDPQREYLLPLT